MLFRNPNLPSTIALTSNLTSLLYQISNLKGRITIKAKTVHKIKGYTQCQPPQNLELHNLNSIKS